MAQFRTIGCRLRSGCVPLVCRQGLLPRVGDEHLLIRHPVGRGLEVREIQPPLLLPRGEMHDDQAGLGQDRAPVLGGTVLDHHKTAEEELRGLPYAKFDMNKSGAMLAWEHFFPNGKPPRLVEYVQDRDLWKYELPVSREIAAVLRSFPMDFLIWEQLGDDLEERFHIAAAEGGAILRFQTQQVHFTCDRVQWGYIGGHRVPYTNATVFFSEVGEELCKRHPEAPFAAYYSIELMVTNSGGYARAEISTSVR